MPSIPIRHYQGAGTHRNIGAWNLQKKRENLDRREEGDNVQGVDAFARRLGRQEVVKSVNFRDESAEINTVKNSQDVIFDSKIPKLCLA